MRVSHFPVPRPFMLFALVLTMAAPCTVTAGDWPQILGPTRDGRAVDEQLLESWPADGPRQLWTRRVGMGFAGPAVVGQRAIVFHRVGESERVEALDVRTGEQLWQTDFDATYKPGYNSDTGPRCVPVIYKDRVYLFGAAGDLHCVALTDGKKKWSRGAYNDFQGDESYFGAGSTPVVFGDKLMVTVGGRNGAGIVAFSLEDGKTLWKATDEEATYSSPTTATINGQQHVVFLTRDNALSLDAKNGDLRFKIPFGKRGLTVTAASPIVFDDHMFLTASYRIGAKLVKFGEKETTTVWSSDDVMSSQYGTAVHRDGFLYGIHGREDQGVAELRCVEAKSGKVQWTVDGFGVAHLILAGDKLLILKVNGGLVLAAAAPERFRKIAEASISSDTTRALPALADGRLFVKTNRGNGGELQCLVVGKQASD